MAEGINDNGTPKTEQIITPPVAGETTPPIATPVAEPKQSHIDIEDLMAKVRQEEKGKLYPQIDKLKLDLEDKIAKINGYLISVAQKDETISELNAKLEALEIEGDAKLENAKKETSAELEAKLAEATAKLLAKDVEFESFKSKLELENYKATKIKEVDESVADMVFGDSKEAIDASIVKAQELYAKIVAKLGAKAPTPETLPKPNLSGANKPFAELTADDISKMPVKEWGKMREQLGLK